MISKAKHYKLKKERSKNNLYKSVTQKCTKIPIKMLL